MKFKTVRPFVLEMFVFIFVIVGIVFGVLVGNYIEIHFNMHLITVAFIILVMVILISYSSRIINLGIRAMLDYVFQHVKEEEVKIIKVLPYRASVFAEKYGRKGEIHSSIGMYYLYQVKSHRGKFELISPYYLDLCEGSSYIVKVAMLSSIIVTYSEK